MKRFGAILALTLLGGVLLLAQPAVNFLSARVSLDSTGALIVHGNAYGGSAGPATNVANTRVMVASDGGLIVSVAGGTLTPAVIQQPNGSNVEYGGCAWASNVFQCGTTTNGGTARHTRIFAPAAGASVLLGLNGTDYWQVNGASGSGPVGALLAAGASTPVVVTAPTDSTATDAGDLSRLRSASTIMPASGGAGNCGTAFAAAALTADCVVATLPAGMKLVNIYADVTAGFTCSGTCTGTKVVQCGSSAGATDLLAASFNVAATGTAGLTDAQLGSAMVRAAAIQGGFIGSWSATTPVSCRFTSGTGNWGSGAATFVNAGSVKFILVTEQIK